MYFDHIDKFVDLLQKCFFIDKNKFRKEFNDKYFNNNNNNSNIISINGKLIKMQIY